MSAGLAGSAGLARNDAPEAGTARRARMKNFIAEMAESKTSRRPQEITFLRVVVQNGDVHFILC